MALPTTRDITLAPGSQIPSTLLNNLQDAIISGAHGLLWHKIGAADWNGNSAQINAATISFASASIGVGPNRWSAASAGQIAVWSPPFTEGSVIEEFEIHEQDNNVTPNEIRCRESTFGVDSSTSLLGLFTFATAAADKLTSIDSTNYGSVLPLTLVSTLVQDFRFGLTTSTAKFYGGRVRVRRP